MTASWNGWWVGGLAVIVGLASGCGPRPAGVPGTTSASSLTSAPSPTSLHASEPTPASIPSAPESLPPPEVATPPAPVVAEAPAPEPPPAPRAVGVRGDRRTLKNVLVISKGERSVRIARHGALRATCNGELLTPGSGSAPILPLLGVMELDELDEASGCARIDLEVRVYRNGLEGEIAMSAWVDVADLAPVVTRPTRLAEAPETVFEDGIHGLWLGNGLEVVRVRELGEWTEVRTPTTKPERHGFVRSADLGLAFDQMSFEARQRKAVHARDDQPLSLAYSPEGPPIAETSGGHPIKLTDAHVELADVDHDAPLAIIGFAPRSLVTEPKLVEEDVWGGLVGTGDGSELGPDEVDVDEGTELWSPGDTRLGKALDRVRLTMGEAPGTVVVETSWGPVAVVLKEPKRRKPR